jgi:hypothetical protein
MIRLTASSSVARGRVKERGVPVHSLHVMQAGTRGRSVFVRARDAKGRPVTGLRADSDGAGAASIREGEGAAHPIHLTPAPVGEHVGGGFAEVDPVLLPGVYQLGLPDELLAPGSTRAMVVVTLPGAVVDPIELDLVAYDPQDAKCIGMSQLGDERRHQFLRQALPRLTELELEAGREAEARLAEEISAERH